MRTTRARARAGAGASARWHARRRWWRSRSSRRRARARSSISSSACGMQGRERLRWLLRRGQWMILPLLVLGLAEIFVRATADRVPSWYGAVERLAAKRSVGALFVGSSRVQAAILPSAFEQALAEKGWPGMVALNLGRGYTTDPQHGHPEPAHGAPGHAARGGRVRRGARRPPLPHALGGNPVRWPPSPGCWSTCSAPGIAALLGMVGARLRDAHASVGARGATTAGVLQPPRACPRAMARRRPAHRRPRAVALLAPPRALGDDLQES